MKLYCATTNPGKLREFRMAVEAEPLPGLDRIAPCEETGATFEENAAGKALYYSRHAAGPLFADDSGLEVRALGGAPGVMSARFAGAEACDEANNRLLVERLRGVEDRAAQFVCVVALAEKGALIRTFRGVVEGRILDAPRGSNGFGYDPLFFYEPFDRTFGEVSAERKLSVSHRARALRQMAEFLLGSSHGWPPRSILGIVVFLILTACVEGQVSRPSIPALVKQMTLEEKLTLVHGARDVKALGQAGYWPGLARLGIPPLRLADGPGGVNVSAEASGLPAPAGLAATFDSEAARLYGVVLGRNARALEQDILLAPYVNIVRDPLFRRNHTTLGEDPLLNARLGAAQIGGIQSQGVMAQVKHLAGYNGPDSVVIDERTLHEIYLPAFEAAVKAGAASVMCAYNKVNGAWSCENSEIQNGILRGRWGFQGFITSDWGAVHSARAITQGVDLEMPGRLILGRAGPYFTDALKAAVESGEVPVSAIDQAVTRILRQMERFQLLDAKQPARRTPIDIEADAKIIREIAGRAAVLLKNDGGALPLSAADLASLAVIGPTGGQVAVGCMAERAYGFESRFISPLEALRKTAPGARITYSAGNDLTGVLLAAPAALEPGASYSWAQSLTVPSEGDYTFMAQTGDGGGSAGSAEIAIDGLTVLRTGGFRGSGVVEKKWSSLLPTTDGLDNSRATLRLTAGAHQIQITANSTGKTPWKIRFAWMTPELRQASIQAAADGAKSVRTPVVFVWNETGGALALPEDQDELIRRVAAANPRTIVVLTTGGPVAMPWKDSVRAILQTWYPGQEGGWATADLLLGRANPGGKLPVTFPVRIEDAPARAAGHPERWAPLPPPGGSGIGTNAPAVALPETLAAGYRLILNMLDRLTPAATFSEGIAVGYRWYDQQNIEPLFPFGHGLSYTRFQYSKLAVKRSEDGFDVSFTLRNTGSRKGAEVPQVYLGPVSDAPVPMAPKSLAGFQRVELGPGRSRRVTVHIDGRGLSYWSVERHGWVVPQGHRPIYVGSSSRDIRLESLLPSTTRG